MSGALRSHAVLPSKPSGWDVGPAFQDESAPSDQAEWLAELAKKLQPTDGHILAMHNGPSNLPERPAFWRLIAYIGDSWDQAGDGWADISLTGDDPISTRNEASVCEVWRGSIERSRAEYAQRKATES